MTSENHYLEATNNNLNVDAKHRHEFVGAVKNYRTYDHGRLFDPTVALGHVATGSARKGGLSQSSVRGGIVDHPMGKGQSLGVPSGPRGRVWNGLLGEHTITAGRDPAPMGIGEFLVAWDGGSVAEIRALSRKSFCGRASLSEVLSSRTFTHKHPSRNPSSHRIPHHQVQQFRLRLIADLVFFFFFSRSFVCFVALNKRQVVIRLMLHYLLLTKGTELLAGMQEKELNYWPWGTSGVQQESKESSFDTCLVYPTQIYNYHAEYRYPIRQEYEYAGVLEVPVLHRLYRRVWLFSLPLDAHKPSLQDWWAGGTTSSIAVNFDVATRCF
ncbi:hypothetical protein RHMOL_Rhmol07G0183300 [Rhododendron molle]|uniref:Uncharacterized protein n=1 Tax=Rhododendron molle TaxID=49168 RepID=A0ACC0N2A6_RHOML|nr:hypothetical protein RHMOL_Rhmol07G0183300 [Rhododendron molle]